jgi:non-lysosomal glucosylceramidase
MARSSVPYSRKQLLSRDPLPPLTGRKLDEVAFPLGGIGTGMVSLGGWGQLRDWEIRNRPAKGYTLPNAFFTLKVGTGKQAVTKVLQGPIGGSFVGDGHTVPVGAGQGLPRFRNVSFDGRFPIANVKLSDPTVPLAVELEAFNPFIPLNDRDSGIPVAILTYRLRNRSKRAVKATIFGNLTNIAGEGSEAQPINRKRTASGLTGLFLSADQSGKPAPDFGSLALATTCEDTSVWINWRDDRISKFWEAIAESDVFPPRGKGGSKTGTVAARCTVKPGETVAVTFLITWHFPVFEHWRKPECGCAPSWRNYYATLWADAWEAAVYTARNLLRLERETRLFRDTLFASTLPTVALDAVSSQISILKTPTCLRLEDGTFYGFEGCSNTVGCCEGSCTHVWNYGQALPYLFPKLQRFVREAEWANSMLDDGFVVFRMPLPLGTKGQPTFHPAADGQMGTVMQAYREWLICGDDEWLQGIWPQAKRALEFAWKYWDADRDGVMEGMQHNTYDMEFYGPNTMMGSLYLGALRAGEEMAKVVGDEEAARTYRDLFERGSAWTDEHLFNGEFYEQQVNSAAHLPWPANLRKMAEDHGLDDKYPWPRWQFGKGCLSDQLIGQWYAEMLQLGPLYKRSNIRKTLRSIFRYNWRAELFDHACLLRLYALNDEAGLIIGTWPKGGRPGYAFWFADEVWCGIEYQVAGHLIYEGMVDEGLAIVKGVRDRYTGERRSPWDEIECGHHYARSMASYSVMLALAGFRYSAPAKRIGFGPRLFAEDFACFFSVASGWGLYSQKLSRGAVEATLKVEHGALTVSEIEIDSPAPAGAAVAAKLGRTALPASLRKRGGGLTVCLDEPVTVPQGETLRVAVR